MNQQKRREQIKLINKTFDRLSGCCEHQDYFPKYYDLCRSEEKRHRSGNRYLGVADGLTVTQAAKYYACYDVFRWMKEGEKPPDVKNFLFQRRGLYMGYAMLHEHYEQIVKEFSDVEVNEFCEMCDYVALNQDPSTDGTRLDNDKRKECAL